MSAGERSRKYEMNTLLKRIEMSMVPCHFNSYLWESCNIQFLLRVATFAFIKKMGETVLSLGPDWITKLSEEGCKGVAKMM